MVNALLAGTIVAVLAAVVGWYVVLRRQTFASHTLSVMAFPGAAGAALVGAADRARLLRRVRAARRWSSAAAGASSRRGYGGETATIGTVQTVGLAAGFLFLSLNQSVLGEPESLLFGTFLGHHRRPGAGPARRRAGRARRARRDRAGRSCSPASIATAPRPAAFRSPCSTCLPAGAGPGHRRHQPDHRRPARVRAARRSPPPAPSTITAAPAGRPAAQRRASPWSIVWLGLAIAYFSIYPVGFYVTTLAFGLYVVLRGARWLRERRR